MKIKQILFSTLALFALTFQTLAIEGLTLSIESTNAVLRWPSVEGETYIVQSRASLDTNDTWQTVTNLYPALTGTNLTTFVHTNAVCVPIGIMSGSDGFPSWNSSSSFLSFEEESSYPPSPPAPWDTSTWANNSSSSTSSSTSLSSEENENLSEGDGGRGVCHGFYRVVRNGVFLVGVTNGTTVGGKIPLAIEVGLLDGENVTGFIITSTNGESIRGIDSLATAEGRFMEFLWDTAQAQNGTYQLVPQVQLGLDTSVTGAVKTVTVHNDVRFPTGFPLAGMAMRIEAQTIHTNGTWTMEFYDDENFNIGSLSGDVDGNGFCNYPGIPGPGFSIDLTDTNGIQLPSSFYTAVVTTTPVAASGGNNAAGTTKIFVEEVWNYATKYAVAYQGIYQQYSTSDTYLFEMMAHVVAQCRLRWPYYVQDAVINAPPGGEPYKLRFASHWTQLALDLKTRQNSVNIVRNFFYFGHGGPDHIGYTNPDLQLSTPQLARMLFNNPFVKTNAHPFRFVFLDGCETAKGQFCELFGIPEKKYTAAQFIAERGLRPRAFLGWKDKSFIGIVNVLSPNHKQFIEEFYSEWPVITGGVQTRLEEAIFEAARDNTTGGHYTDLDEKLTLYGCPDLYFYEGP